MPDVFVEDGSVGELGVVGGLGLGTVEMALPMRDFGLLLGLYVTTLEPCVQLVG